MLELRYLKMKFLTESEIREVLERNRISELPPERQIVLHFNNEISSDPLSNIIVQICITTFITSRVTQTRIFIPISYISNTLPALAVYFKKIVILCENNGFNAYILGGFQREKLLELDQLTKIFHPIISKSLLNYCSYVIPPQSKNFSYVKYDFVLQKSKKIDFIATDEITHLLESFEADVGVWFPYWSSLNEIEQDHLLYSYYESGYEIVFCGWSNEKEFWSHTVCLFKKA